MKGAIASVEIYAIEGGLDSDGTRRLTLTITAPERATDREGWQCSVALADLHRPEVVSGVDSVSALSKAIARAKLWLSELRAQGMALARDRTGDSVFELD